MRASSPSDSKPSAFSNFHATAIGLRCGKYRPLAAVVGVCGEQRRAALPNFVRQNHAMISDYRIVDGPLSTEHGTRP
eukprot:scaffold68664_cov28-Tisochrysis_lutea.AAC.1